MTKPTQGMRHPTAMVNGVTLKRILLCILSVTGLCLFACTGYHWRYNFIPGEAYRPTDIGGWIFEPELSAYKWLPRGADSAIASHQYFSIKFQFEIPNKEEVQTFHNIQLDDVIVSYFSAEKTDTLVITATSFGGLDKTIRKSFTLSPQTPTATTTPAGNELFIPLETDSIRLSFDAVLQAGEPVEYLPAWSPNILHDSIAVFDDALPVVVPISVTLYRQLDKLGTTVGLMDRNLNRK